MPLDGCSNCGDKLSTEAAVCPLCGASRAIVVTPQPAVLRLQGHAPSIIIAGPDPQTGDAQIRVDSPGASSRTRLESTGVRLEVKGVEAIGRGGERQLAKTLHTKLQQEGVAATITAGQDDRGEDAILRAKDRTLVLQAVTVPGIPEFWGEASKGIASRQVNFLAVVQCLRDAIKAKARKYSDSQRAKILLAIDARHAGMFATKPIVEEYLGRHASPAAEYGFASVWVVGPTAEHCARLGEGAL